MSEKLKKFFTNFYLMEMFVGMLLYVGVFSIFYRQYCNLTFSQILFLEAWLSLSQLTLEIPLGVIADNYGRKRTILAGIILFIGAVLLRGLIPSFVSLMIANSLIAGFEACWSGSEESIIYDSLKSENKENEFQKYYGKVKSHFLMGRMMASPIGGFIAAKYGIIYAILLTIIPLIIAFLFGSRITETHIITRKDRRTEIKRIFVGGLNFFKNSYFLKVLTFDMIVLSSISAAFYWIYQSILQTENIPVSYFGIIYTIMILFQITLLNSYGKIEKIVKSKKKILLGTMILQGIALILLGIVRSVPVTLFLILIVDGLGSTRRALCITYASVGIPSNIKATVFSVMSMIRNIGIVFVCPIVGVIMDNSLQKTLISIGIFGLISSIVLSIYIKKLSFEDPLPERILN